METTIMGFKGYIGILEKKMEITIMGFKGYIGVILGLGLGLSWRLACTVPEIRHCIHSGLRAWDSDQGLRF